MKTPKYLVWTDHRAGFNHMDQIVGLESKKILDVMVEIEEMLKDDDHLYCVCVYEKIAKSNEYVQILRSDNKTSYYVEESLYNIRRSLMKIDKTSYELFDFVAK